MFICKTVQVTFNLVQNPRILMTSSEFSSLSITKRLHLLKKNGEFVGTRIIPSYQVSLFTLHGFYVELFVLRSLNQVQWIEVQTNKQILIEYTKNIDLDDLFS